MSTRLTGPLGEVWVKAPVATAGYEVSNIGRVRSLDREVTVATGGTSFRKGRVLKLQTDKDGYKYVFISGRAEKIHRLVCEAFNGSPGKGDLVVRHMNAIRSDNRPGNLAWGTRKENSAGRKAHGNDPNLGKTHCPAGHPYSGDNLRKNLNGSRVCRVCSNRRSLESYHRRKVDK